MKLFTRLNKFSTDRVLKKKHFKSLGKSFGSIVVRHRGGSNIKKKFRIVDYYKSLWNVPGFVLNFEYNPSKKGSVMLVSFFIGVISYNISIKGLSVGSLISSSGYIRKDPHTGNTAFLKFISKKIKICLLESYPCSGSKFLRSSNSWGKIILKNKFYSIIKLKSGLSRKFNNLCCATAGRVFLFEYKLPLIKKAGLTRLFNIRPSVRGVAMNPVDHPYGGGKGKKSTKSVLMGPWGRVLIRKK